MTEPHSEEIEFEDLLARMAELTDQLEQLDASTAAPAFELLDLVEAWHRAGLQRLVDLLPAEALADLRADPMVGNLLDTYLDDEPDEDVDPHAVVEEALEDIRPYLHTHGGEMELESIDGGVVTLRLLGACDGCPSSMVTLSQGVEEALRARWRGFQRLEVKDAAPQQAPPQLLQIQSLRRPGS